MIPLAYALTYEFTQSITDADGVGGSFNDIRSIAVNSTHIFVVDLGDDKVIIFDSSGNFAGTFGSSGSGNGQFSFPIGIAVNSTHIFVSDAINERVQIFDRNCMRRFERGRSDPPRPRDRTYSRAIRTN